MVEKSQLSAVDVQLCLIFNNSEVKITRTPEIRDHSSLSALG